MLTQNKGPSKDAAIASTNPPKSAAASGLVQGSLEGQDDDGDDDDDHTGADMIGDGQTSNGE
jgi:methionyl aminopeptidase